MGDYGLASAIIRKYTPSPTFSPTLDGIPEAQMENMLSDCCGISEKILTCSTTHVQNENLHELGNIFIKNQLINTIKFTKTKISRGVLRALFDSFSLLDTVTGLVFEKCELYFDDMEFLLDFIPCLKTFEWNDSTLIPGEQKEAFNFNKMINILASSDCLESVRLSARLDDSHVDAFCQLLGNSDSMLKTCILTSSFFSPNSITKIYNTLEKNITINEFRISGAELYESLFNKISKRNKGIQLAWAQYEIILAGLGKGEYVDEDPFEELDYSIQSLLIINTTTGKKQSQLLHQSLRSAVYLSNIMVDLHELQTRLANEGISRVEFGLEYESIQGWLKDGVKNNLYTEVKFEEIMSLLNHIKTTCFPILRPHGF